MISSDSPYIKNVTFFFSLKKDVSYDNRKGWSVTHWPICNVWDRLTMSDTLQCLKPYIPSPHHWHRFANFATGFCNTIWYYDRDTIKPCRFSHRLALKNRIPFNTFSSNVKNIAIRHFQRHQNFFSGNKDEKKTTSQMYNI